jgi:hypothetical protein
MRTLIFAAALALPLGGCADMLINLALTGDPTPTVDCNRKTWWGTSTCGETGKPPRTPDTPNPK